MSQTPGRFWQKIKTDQLKETRELVRILQEGLDSEDAPKILEIHIRHGQEVIAQIDQEIAVCNTMAARYLKQAAELEKLRAIDHRFLQDHEQRLALLRETL